MSMVSDPMSAALSSLFYTIPPAILNKVFITRSERWRSTHHSLSERIMEEVIRPRVLQDLNIAYGQEITILLDGCPRVEVDPYTTVYTIPKELTQGRAIISALNITYGTPGFGTVAGGFSNVNASPIQAASAALMTSANTMPTTTSHHCVLIGENKIMVKDSLRLAGQCYIRCMVENDERMSHLHYKGIPLLKEVVTYAVKAYIYNAYIIEMGEAELIGGQELGVFKSVIENYADAEELYQTILKERYARAAMSVDQPKKQRFIKAIIGGFR